VLDHHELALANTLVLLMLGPDHRDDLGDC
jgi:hypothetical protein